MAEDLFQQAVSALKAGRKDEARGLLMDIVEQNPRHEQAWLYLSVLVDSLDEQQICLENVLTVNPNNEKAKQALMTVKQKLSDQQNAAPPDAWADFATPSPPPDSGFVSPFGGPPPVGAETGNKNLFGEPAFGVSAGDSSSAFGGGFDFGAESTPDTAQSNDDPFSWLNDAPGQTNFAPSAPPSASDDSDLFSASASSVDWSRDDQPATYGSGRQIDEPTSDEYDEWMDNLPLGTDTADSNFGSEFGSTPFGDTSFMVEEDPLFEQQAPADDSFWDASFGSESSAPSSDDSFATFGVQEFSPSNDDLFESAGGFVEDAAEEPGSFGSTFGLSKKDSAGFFVEPEPSGLSDGGFDFSFDDDLDSQGPVRVDEVKVKPGGKAAAPAKTAAAQAASLVDAEYYRLIPPEIEPFEGGISQRTLMLAGGIGIMLVLNGVSLLLLVM